MITKPGIYPDMTSAEYFADPTPEPSLTQSLIKTLIERSPLHAWCEHPRLNPDFVANEDTKFDVGNVAHKLLIGRGKGVVRVEFDDWRKKKAQTTREKYAELGVLAVLGHQYDRAADMATAARQQLAQTPHADAFIQGAGSGEAVVAWRDEGFWCRTMIDWLMPDCLRIYDYKSTALSCAPHDIAERASTQGWDIQGAWHEQGLDAVDPKNAGRRRHFFVGQEDQPPYALTVVQLSEADLTMGRKKTLYALTRWKICMARKKWSGYPTATVMSEPRGYLENKWLEREVRESDRDAHNLMAG